MAYGTRATQSREALVAAGSTHTLSVGRFDSLTSWDKLVYYVCTGWSKSWL